MTDQLGRARDIEQFTIQNAMDNRVRYVGTSAPECEECGDDIPEARRNTLPGVKTCVYCAAAKELRR